MLFFSPCHKPNIERGHDIMIILWTSGMANFMPTTLGFASAKSWWRLGCLTLSHVGGGVSYPSGSEQPVLCDQKSTKILTYPKIWKSRIQTVRAMMNNGVPGSVSIQCNLAKVGAMEPRRLVLVSILHVDSRSDWPQLWFPSYLQAPRSCDWDISAFGIIQSYPTHFLPNSLLKPHIYYLVYSSIDLSSFMSQ